MFRRRTWHESLPSGLRCRRLPQFAPVRPRSTCKVITVVGCSLWRVRVVTEAGRGHPMVDLRWDQIDSTRQACTLGGPRKVHRPRVPARLPSLASNAISITTSRDRIVIAAWV
jgi:hypothetical protein